MFFRTRQAGHLKLRIIKCCPALILFCTLITPLNMAIKPTPPFRVEHVGSLLRPDYLLEARKKFDNKEVTAEQLKEIEDRAIIEAIKLQREVGIKGITDGEYRLVS